MNDDRQKDNPSNYAILYIIGIGTEGCRGIQYIKDKGDNEGVTLVAIHSDVETLAKSGADTTVLVKMDKLLIDASGLPDKHAEAYLINKLGTAIKQGDAFFILPSYRGNGYGLLSACICKLLSENFKRSHSAFVLALAITPNQADIQDQHYSYRRTYKQLLKHCDTVILNPVQCIRQPIKQSQSSPSYDLIQSFETNYQAIKSITDLIILPGLVGFDFADAAAIFVNRGEAIFAIGRGAGEGRVFRAITCAFKDLQGQWGLLSNPNIGAVLINVTTADISPKEFNVVSDFFHLQVLDSTIIKVGTTIDCTMPKEELKIAVILVKDKPDNLGSWSQYQE